MNEHTTYEHIYMFPFSIHLWIDFYYKYLCIYILYVYICTDMCILTYTYTYIKYMYIDLQVHGEETQHPSQVPAHTGRSICRRWNWGSLCLNSEQQATLCLGGDVISSLKIACCKHNHERWPKERTVRPGPCNLGISARTCKDTQDRWRTGSHKRYIWMVLHAAPLVNSYFEWLFNWSFGIRYNHYSLCLY